MALRFCRTGAAFAFVALAACGPTTGGNYDPSNYDVRGAIQAVGVGQGDSFDVWVYREKELSGTFVVSAGGTIDFPLIGTLSVEGLEAEQIARLIRQNLSQSYLRNPHVTVSLREVNSKKVFVLGQVSKPGRFLYSNNMTIVEAITLAGGFKSMAEKNHTIVTRLDGAGERRIPIPVEKIMQGLVGNFRLQPGDIVYVPESLL